MELGEKRAACRDVEDDVDRRLHVESRHQPEDDGEMNVMNDEMKIDGPPRISELAEHRTAAICVRVAAYKANDRRGAQRAAPLTRIWRHRHPAAREENVDELLVLERNRISALNVDTRRLEDGE